LVTWLRVAVIFRKAYQIIYFVCLCQVWHFLPNKSSNLQISVHYKLLLWILLFCDCSKFKYLFLTERIYYSGQFCEVNYIWCWSCFTETNHMKPTLKQCLLILQHWWCLFQAQNAKSFQFFYLHLISEADFAFILVSFLIDTQLRHWVTFCCSYWCSLPINMKNVTCITWSEASTEKVPLSQPLKNSHNPVFHYRNCFFLAVIHSGNLHKYFCLCQLC